MGIQLHDGVENIVGKGEIARYEQFLLFPQCFQKLPHSLLLVGQNEYLCSKGLRLLTITETKFHWLKPIKTQCRILTH